MKKTLLLILIGGLIVPTTTFAQKKKDKKKNKKQTEQTTQALVLKTSNDTISYAFGANMSEGLTQYLIQEKVLIDTVSISNDYKNRIDNESDAKKKEALTKEFSNKLDSAKNVNAINKEKFLEGVKKALFSSNDAAFDAGVTVAGQLKSISTRFSEEALKEGESLNLHLFADGFTSALNGEKLKIEKPYEYVNKAIEENMAYKKEAEEKALKEKYAETIATGDKFMKENSSKPGVTVLPSGLQYKVLTMGTGNKPKDGEKVKAHYHGTLIDGTVFDSSVERGEPIEFRVGQLIKGWNEGLTLMPEGSKWVLYIPYDLAYGASDQGSIKPFSNLIFEVELIKVGE